MNYKKLKRYRKLVYEERTVRMKLGELEAGAEHAADTVQASLTEWPYTAGHVKIEGLTAGGAAEVTEKGQALRQALRRIRAEKEKIERFIGRVKDPVVKALLEAHVLEGLTWRAASDRVYGFGLVAESTAMMTVLRYLGGRKN